MNNSLNEYFGFYFELNIELNHFFARFNEKMNIQNVSVRAIATMLPMQMMPPIYSARPEYYSIITEREK